MANRKQKGLKRILKSPPPHFPFPPKRGTLPSPTYSQFFRCKHTHIHNAKRKLKFTKNFKPVACYSFLLFSTKFFQTFQTPTYSLISPPTFQLLFFFHLIKKTVPKIFLSLRSFFIIFASRERILIKFVWSHCLHTPTRWKGKSFCRYIPKRLGGGKKIILWRGDDEQFLVYIGDRLFFV